MFVHHTPTPAKHLRVGLKPGGLDRPLCPGEKERERERETERELGGQLAGGFDRPLMPWGRRQRGRERERERESERERETGQ